MIALRFNPRICTKALYSNPGICRCPRCRPDLHLPNSGGTGPLPAPAAVREPQTADGGNPSPSPGGLAAPADPPAADRNPSLSDAPVGGPCLEERN